MSNRSFKKRLTAGEKLYGTMITMPDPTTAEVLSHVGFDWFFVDGEHGPLGTTEILSILRAVAHKIPCVVRVPKASEVAIKKFLDIGADGIIVPQVNSPETAEAVVQWSKYPPQGRRGVGLARAHGYGSEFTTYVENANDEVAIVVQAEDIAAVKNINEITAVAGIDAIQLGPYDLSASMNLMGQITHPEVSHALDTICQAALSAKLPIGCFGMSAEAVQRDIVRGATMICLGTDTSFLLQGASKMLAHIKSN